MTGSTTTVTGSTTTTTEGATMTRSTTTLSPPIEASASLVELELDIQDASTPGEVASERFSGTFERLHSRAEGAILWHGQWRAQGGRTNALLAQAPDGIVEFWWILVDRGSPNYVREVLTAIDTAQDVLRRRAREFRTA